MADKTDDLLDRIDEVLSPDAMRWNAEDGPRSPLDQCDEFCHIAGLDVCVLCDSCEWELMCDSCRFYALQDAE